MKQLICSITFLMLLLTACEPTQHINPIDTAKQKELAQDRVLNDYGLIASQVVVDPSGDVDTNSNPFIAIANLEKTNNTDSLWLLINQLGVDSALVIDFQNHVAELLEFYMIHEDPADCMKGELQTRANDVMLGKNCNLGVQARAWYDDVKDGAIKTYNTCAFTAIEGIGTAAYSVARGCMAGPWGCVFGGGYAIFKIATTVHKLCKQCGCN